MSLSLHNKIVESMCGRMAYHKGKADFQSGKVSVVRYQPGQLFEAAVTDKGRSEVSVRLDDPSGTIAASCSCPTLGSYSKHCKHIAAALLCLIEIQRSDRPESAADAGGLQPQVQDPPAGTPREEARLVESMLGLFRKQPARSAGSGLLHDPRDPLHVQFICTLLPYGYRKQLFGIQMKVGLERLYIVQRIREFLEQLDKGKSYPFAKLFTYDPEFHRFKNEDESIIRQLTDIAENEQLYRDSNVFPVRSKHQTDRTLLLPPLSWDSLLPLLTRAETSVLVEHPGGSVHPLQLSDEPVPLHFDFRQTGNGNHAYELEVTGLDDVTVLESYGVVLTNGKLLQLPSESCSRLSELKQMFGDAGRRQLPLSPVQLESMMDRAVPGLMKLGRVQIAEAVSEKFIKTPLRASLYLDRVKEKMLAALEFHYGDITINPLEPWSAKRSSDRILVRDGELERQILELMEQSSFVRTESGYRMDDEDGEYDFLVHTVPRLEKLVKVYATSNVKERIYPVHVPPKITVDVNDKVDWLEARFDIETIPEAEIRKVLQSLEEKRRYHKMPDGALLPLESEEFQEIVRCMNELGVRMGEADGTTFRLPVVRGLQFMDTDRQSHAVRLGKTLRRLLTHMRNPDHLDFPVPDNLAPVLRDYQQYGYQWLRTLAHYRFGGILADEMGLGKTVQAIAFLVSMLPEIRAQELPAIIVSPASLVYNWQNELHKFAPDIRAAIADGSKVERNKFWKNAAGLDVIITSYPLLRRDIEANMMRSFHTLILDEAQFFKNHATQTAHAVKQLQAPYRFALTGTPVENRLEELWTLYDVVFPGLFPGRKAFNELSRSTVAKKIRPFLLRRLKSDVLTELPEKIETLHTSELLPEQKKLYAAYLAKLQKEALKHLSEASFHKNRIKILAGLTRLRQLCCHPALFVENYNGSSAKFEQLLDIVEECQSAGKRVLLFSQFTEMLGLIGREIGARGIPFFYLDGSTPPAERVELCGRFNEGERDLFLISLKAGGTGLNLTGADTVVLYDLWWNPAVEQQAADRAHRIGQKKVVQIIRLLAQGTVEEKMYDLQQKKLHLIEDVIRPGQESLSSFTEADIRELLLLG
ncbi:SNF2 helicase associated domain-containing protein [Paenibacillus sp. GCM10012303]|uniref:DEAD/DEAH box helicase n=1 Tax=Paenibacillus sp. GCM10012303 TaxID=3317340 RepID=UPI003617F31D